MDEAGKARVFLTDRAITDLQKIESCIHGQGAKTQAAEYRDAFDRCFALVES
jgi:plasmid stabilization system protein ParE